MLIPYNMNAKVIIRLIGLALLSSPAHSQDYRVSEFAFEIAPRHCKTFYTSLYMRGTSIGIKIDTKKYNIDRWRKRCGGACPFMNHYCPGLTALVEAEYPRLANSKKPRGPLLMVAESGIRYLLDQSRWSKGNLWLKAEAHSKLAQVHRLRGNKKEAISEYQLAIHSYSKHIPAYVGLAEVFEQYSMYDDAIAELEKAQRHRPSSKILAKRIKALKQKKSDPEPKK